MDSKIPDGLEELDTVYSNFDHELNEEVAEQLRAGKNYAQHAAWDFCGYIWFSEGQFHNEIWVYGSPKEVKSGRTILKVIADANEDYGNA